MTDTAWLVLVLGGARSGKSAFAEELADRFAAARAAQPGATAAPPSSNTSDDATRTAGAAADAAGAAPPSGAGRVTYLATAQALDDEMRDRIARHRRERPDTWATVECPLDVAAALLRSAAATDTFLLDCVTFWVSNLLMTGGELGDPVPEGLGDFDKSFIAPEVERAASACVHAGLDAFLSALRETGATVVAVSNEVGLGVVPEYPLARLYRDELGRANRRLAEVADQVYLLVAGIALEIKAPASLPPSPPAPPSPFSPSSQEEPEP